MSILNKPSCSTSTGSTGVPDCFIDITKINGIILAKKSKYFSVANMLDSDTFKTAMQTAMLATGDERIYPIFEFQALTDNSEDIVKATTGYGRNKVVREGVYNWLFELASGGLCLSANLRKFNFQRGYGVYLVDDNNVVLGRKDSDGKLFPFTLEYIHTHAMKLNDGSNEAKYMLEVEIPDKKELADNFGAVQCDFDVDSNVLGILDIELTELAVVSDSPNVLTVGIQLNCGKTDLYSDFGAALIADKTLFTLKDSAGAPVVITTATASATTGGIDITFTGNAGEYTIELVNATTLAAASIGGSGSYGYESNVLGFTIVSGT